MTKGQTLRSGSPRGWYTTCVECGSKEISALDWYGINDGAFHCDGPGQIFCDCCDTETGIGDDVKVNEYLHSCDMCADWVR